MKLWKRRVRLLLGFGMNKDQSLEEEGLGTSTQNLPPSKINAMIRAFEGCWANEAIRINH
jgi:hypothetical protein